MLEYQM